MNRNILLLICTTISVTTIYASPVDKPDLGCKVINDLGCKVINQDAQPVAQKVGIAVCSSNEVQERVDKLTETISAVLVGAIKAAPITKEQAKLGKEFAGIAKSIITLERQETQATGQKLKLAGLRLRGYVIYKKLLSMMQLRAELTKALLNEFQKPRVIENIVTQAHELVRLVLENVEAQDARIQELCDLLSQEQIKKLCVGTLSHVYERSVRPSPAKNSLLASGLTLKLKQYFEQVDLACKKCFSNGQTFNTKESVQSEQKLLKALSALVLRMEERMYDAVEHALHAKS